MKSRFYYASQRKNIYSHFAFKIQALDFTIKRKRLIFASLTNMNTNMEKLLHYVWRHRMFPDSGLRTEEGENLDIIDTGLPNMHAGPDFFNAKVKVGGQLWVGNVELHERASDWYRHRHDTNAAYDNVVLHVCGTMDHEARTLSGRLLPQVRLEVPTEVNRRYEELLAEETYPPCHRAIPHIDTLTAASWLSALTAERLEEKTVRTNAWLERTGGDWERVFFITLARSFGFGVNAEAFEQWAAELPLGAVAKHRDDRFQVEAFFLGGAGLLTDDMVAPERRDNYFIRLQKEYTYLTHKFSLTPMAGTAWRFLRMRPQNFPHVRLAQLVDLYHSRRLDLSRLLEARKPSDFHALLSASVTPYWETHYCFGRESQRKQKALQATSIDLLVINAAAPLIFAYGRAHMDEALCERAFELLEHTRAEKNFITRSWEAAGLKATSAAESQALIRLRHHYCDRKDCLRCRFGAAYLAGKRKNHQLSNI